MTINRDIGIEWTMEDIRDIEGNLISQQRAFFINGTKYLIMRVAKLKFGMLVLVQPKQT